MADKVALKAGSVCREKGWTLAVAESCTGGLLGGRITAVPGSSEFFLGGVIAYSDRLKISLLAVPEDIIARHGAVSAQAAALMAEGVRDLTGADVGISVTGVAGPAGSEAKPPGIVYSAVITPTNTTVRQYNFSGDREIVRLDAVTAALELFMGAVLDEES